jgi:UDP-3-O-[3-hydroxymyristoyl] N-acetylglucosamine deacetylase/3-hydroxyacyl-[acyl-carrier-protein] dehydratase
MTDYQFSSLGTQYTALYSLEEDFIEEFAPSRTFCFFSEIKGMKEQGLIKGGSVDNALVFLDKEVGDSEIADLKEMLKIDSDVFCGDNGILNGVELRYPNEPVRHKALDLIGDLALLGIPIRGHIIAARSGHAANVELVKKIKVTFAKKLALKKQQRENNMAQYDIHSILQILPHRYPFLLVDKILELEPGKTVKALKNVTYNEPFFQGHFPGQPVMPGVLLLEAMAQASGFLVLNTIPNPETKLMYFTGINKSRFKKVVIPGDQLIFEAELVKFRLGTCKIIARALVDDKIVCSAEFLSSVVDRRD